jgi:Family of unknown function (DUF6049)
MPAARFTHRRPVKQFAGGVAAMLVFALAGLSAPAVAATPAATITVSATPEDSGDLAAGNPLRIFVAVDNATATDTLAATATVSVASSAASSRPTLADWFSGAAGTDLAATTVGTSPFPVVASTISTGIEVTIPAAALPWTTAGVYPIAVTIGTASKTYGVARSAIAWNVTASTPVPIAVAVPLTVPAVESEFLTAAELTQYTAPAGILTRELADVAGTDVAVGIDPRVIASIRLLGKSAPASVTAWYNQLLALTNDTFPLQWADSDLTGPIQAGQTSVIEPKSLDYAVNASLFPTTPTTPSPAATNGTVTSPTLPTSASLVAWNYTMPALSWPAENSVQNSDLSVLAAAGLTGAILSSANVQQADDRGLGGAAAKAGNTDIAVSDDVLSGYLRTAIQSTTRSSSTEAMTELTTTLALTSLASGAAAQTVLLTTGRNWAASDSNFGRALTGLFARPWTSAASLAGVFEQDPTTVTIVKKSESAGRIALIRSMFTSELGVVSFAPIAKSPDTLTSSTRLRLLSALSNEWTTTTWPAAAKSFLNQGAKIVSSVQVDPGSEILALADQTSLPVSVSNNLDQDVTVTLKVTSTSPAMTIDTKYRSQSVTVDEGAQRRILIPVDALSNGNAEIVATLESSTGVQIGRTVTIRVNVQAGWETVGTLIFAALIVALFAFGIIRTIRRRRRARLEQDVEQDAA